MQSTGEALQRFAGQAWVQLSSIQAQRTYVVLIVLAALVGALFRARTLKQRVEKFTGKSLDVRFPGPKPKSNASKKRQEDEAEQRRHDRIVIISLALLEMFALGVVLPCLLLTVATIEYGWFQPGATPLMDANTAVPIAHPSAFEIATYIVDNVLRGGFFDLMEVFKLKVTSISNDVAAYPYLVGLFVFHLYVEGFFIFALYSFVRVLLLVQWKSLQRFRRQRAEASAYPGTTGEPLAVAA